MWSLLSFKGQSLLPPPDVHVCPFPTVYNVSVKRFRTLSTCGPPAFCRRMNQYLLGVQPFLPLAANTGFYTAHGHFR